MRRLFPCLALAVLPALGQGPAGSVPLVAVYYQFERPAPDAVVQSLEDEVGSILTPLGWDIDWRSLSADRSNAISVELAVVSFKGGCALDGPSPRHNSSRVLGRTHISDGVVIPFCDVDCDRVRAFLEKPLNRTERRRRDVMFGRALGRVLAHELYHIFGRTMHHESAGVARPAFTVQEMLADSFRLEENGLRAFETLVAFNSVSTRGSELFKQSGCAGCHGEGGEGSATAPAIRNGERRLSVPGLAARLGDTATRMYRRAQDLRMPWPNLQKREIALLVDYLNAASN